MKTLKRGCYWILGVEALFAAISWAAFQDSTVAWKLLPLLLLAMLLNLPGIGLAHGLGLLGPGGFNPPPDAHPVAGFIVSFVASALFWVAVLWLMSGCRTTGRAPSDKSHL